MVVALRFARFASAGNERFLRASRNYSPQIPVSKRNYFYPLDREMKNRVFFLSFFLSFFFFFTEDGGSVEVSSVVIAQVGSSRQHGQQWKQLSGTTGRIRVLERGGWNERSSRMVPIVPSRVDETQVAAERRAESSSRAAGSKAARDRQWEHHTQRWNDQRPQTADLRLVPRSRQGKGCP